MAKLRRSTRTSVLRGEAPSAEEQIKALADALAAARLVLVIVSDKAKHDSSATLTKIDDALRLAGRLP